jgi:hypothetical protein
LALLSVWFTMNLFGGRTDNVLVGQVPNKVIVGACIAFCSFYKARQLAMLSIYIILEL